MPKPKDELGHDLAERLADYRRRRGLSQQDLAEALETSQPTVHRLLTRIGSRRRPVVAAAQALLAAEITQLGLDEWAARVAAAAKSSESFRAMVDAGLTLMNNHE